MRMDLVWFRFDPQAEAVNGPQVWPFLEVDIGMAKAGYFCNR